MNNEVTIKYLQNPATKGWVWKLYDEAGSVVARSESEFATETEAQAGFEAWKNEPAPTETTEPSAPVNTESAPVAPAQNEVPPTKEELHDLSTQTPDGPTQYEIVNKETGATHAVNGMTFGEGYVEVETEVGVVRFDNANKDGNLVDTDASNPEFAIRQVGTHLTPNNDGVVNDQGVELNPVEGSAN